MLYPQTARVPIVFVRGGRNMAMPQLVCCWAPYRVTLASRGFSSDDSRLRPANTNRLLVEVYRPLCLSLEALFQSPLGFQHENQQSGTGASGNSLTNNNNKKNLNLEA